jgi:hypothetical protein
MTKVMVEGTAYKERSRKKPADFTRKRKMGFKELVYFLLSMINESSQNALERYFPRIGEEEQTMTQQSFSVVRQKLKWEAIRVMAIDGTKVAAETTFPINRLTLDRQPIIRVNSCNSRTFFFFFYVIIGLRNELSGGK